MMHFGEENCKRTADCALFTWYPDTGGCWLQQADAKESGASDSGRFGLRLSGLLAILGYTRLF